MTPISFLLVYLVVWWVVIFAVLPIGVNTVSESDEAQPEGVEGGRRFVRGSLERP